MAENSATGQDDSGGGESLEEALALHRAGKLTEARALYSAILERTPNHPEALHLFGLSAYQMGNLAEAARHIDAALHLRPTQAKYLSNRGNVAKAQGDADGACGYYERAIACDPSFADARFNLGVLLLESRPAGRGRRGPRRRCWKSSPIISDAANNLAMIRLQQGRLAEATAILDGPCRKAGCSRRRRCWSISARSTNSEGRLADAEASLSEPPSSWFPRPVPGTPGSISAICWSSGSGRPTPLPPWSAPSNSIPGLAEAKAALRHQYMYACAWPELARLEPDGSMRPRRDLLATGAARKRPSPTWCAAIIRPVIWLSPQSWAALTAKRHEPLFDYGNHRQKPDGSPLVLGYLSNDICDHATAHLMRSLFAAHDRDRFRINLYSYGPDDGSDYRRRIVADCDVFADIAEADFETAARRIHADRVDILIDLKGWTQGNRLAICAHRPAPVQATYLGFPGTTGAPFLDYAIVDRTVLPPDEARFFSEAPAYMPDCYQVNDGSQEIAAEAGGRNDWGLPADAFVFCGFNHPYKITPEVFAAWMEILRAVPGSVLWLLSGNALAEGNLRAAAEGQGIAAERLIFADKAAKPVHLRRMGLADLALDTWICNGHTTTSDALWAGVPVLALTGRHFASRVSTSCLKAAGLPELVTGSPAAYRNLAIRLATAPDQLAALRARLWENRTRMPLFDTAGFVRALEDLYAAMWERYSHRHPPAQIG